jgi:hypothetical protein
MYIPQNAVDKGRMFKKEVWRGMLRQRKLKKLCENCIGIFLG